MTPGSCLDVDGAGPAAGEQRGHDDHARVMNSRRCRGGPRDVDDRTETVPNSSNHTTGCTSAPPGTSGWRISARTRAGGQVAGWRTMPPHREGDRGHEWSLQSAPEGAGRRRPRGRATVTARRRCPARPRWRAGPGRRAPEIGAGPNRGLATMPPRPRHPARHPVAPPGARFGVVELDVDVVTVQLALELVGRRLDDDPPCVDRWPADRPGGRPRQ